MVDETFDAGWLALREAADHRSRPVGPLDPLVAWCRARPWARGATLRVADLGSGTGSNLRWLAPRLGGRAEWTLVDHDPALLARAAGSGVDRVPGVAAVERVVGDLAGEGLQVALGADLVTASALLDLVSETWLERLVGVCATVRAAALFALTWDGGIEWDGPPDSGDALVRAALADHQRRDKGTGPALGPTAAPAAARRFHDAGYSTTLVASPWRLDAADRALALALLAGWADAAAEQRPADAARIEAWAERRRATLAGEFGLVVGHFDLLALPAS